MYLVIYFQPIPKAFRRYLNGKLTRDGLINRSRLKEFKILVNEIFMRLVETFGATCTTNKTF